MKDLILLFVSMSAFGVGVSSVDSNIFYPATVSYLNLELAKDLRKQGSEI